jgi:DNA invertase Pin-like site-specific DNA recombinase
MVTGQHIGYTRVSTTDQSTSRQLDGIKLDRTFEDKVSGKSTDRPQLKACLDHLRDGDTLHVHSMDRLARNLQDLQSLVSDLTGKGVEVHFHKEALIFNTDTGAMSKLMLQIMGAVAEFERALIKERQAEGIAKARKEGKHLGRKATLTPEQMKELKVMVDQGINKTDVALELVGRLFTGSWQNWRRLHKTIYPNGVSA